MSAADFIKNNPVIVGVGALVIVGGLWLSLRGAKQTGKDIGAGAVNLVVGTVSGVGGAIHDNAMDPNTNPLYDFGTWLGGKVFDITHPTQSLSAGVAKAKAGAK